MIEIRRINVWVVNVKGEMPRYFKTEGEAHRHCVRGKRSMIYKDTKSEYYATGEFPCRHMDGMCYILWKGHWYSFVGDRPRGLSIKLKEKRVFR